MLLIIDLELQLQANEREAWRAVSSRLLGRPEPWRPWWPLRPEVFRGAAGLPGLEALGRLRSQILPIILQPEGETRMITSLKATPDLAGHIHHVSRVVTPQRVKESE